MPSDWTSGRTVAHYRLLERIGAGGMGEVYRAEDTKLRRDVALKVLPDVWRDDTSRVAGLRREALVLASLNHPGIAAVFDLEEADGALFVVMELVEGRSLDELIAEWGPDAGSDMRKYRIARQIAEALEAAHERGVIHRDLKPANVKVLPDDRVKLLDFGLAFRGRPLDPLNTATTISMASGSEAGMLAGTLAYMSPEQARGLPLDKRTDIWSFGCVLYELLTGRRLFQAETPVDLIPKILMGDPPLDDLPVGTPARVRVLLGRCLRHDVQRRLRDAGDARIELTDVIDGVADVGAPVQVVPRQVRFQRLTDTTGHNESPAISPDGKMVAFVARTGDWRQIWVRMLAGGAPLQVTHDPVDHRYPRWAQDSSALIYYTPAQELGEAGMLWETSALGGPPRPIVPAMSGGDVSHAGDEIAVIQRHGTRAVLSVVARDGTRARQLEALPEGNAYAYPRWAPDDKAIAIQVEVASYFDRRIYLLPVSGAPAREVTPGGILSGLSWLPDGRGLVYASSANSPLPYPATFNLRAIDCDGTNDRALTYGDASYVDPDVHPSGLLVVGRARTRSDIWRFPVDGSPADNMRDRLRVTRQTGQVQAPSISPDGRQLVYLSDNGGLGNLWVVDATGGSPRQITFERDPETGVGVPVWAPVGRRIVFIRRTGGESALWLINGDGSGLRQLTPAGVAATWSLDGNWVYYTPRPTKRSRLEKISVTTGETILVRDDSSVALATLPEGGLLVARRLNEDPGDWELRLARPETAAGDVILVTPGHQAPVSPSFPHVTASTDSRWLAIFRTDGTTTNIAVRPIEGDAERPITDFGDRPVMIVRRVAWSPDGRYIYAAVAESDTDIVLLDGLV